LSKVLCLLSALFSFTPNDSYPSTPDYDPHTTRIHCSLQTPFSTIPFFYLIATGHRLVFFIFFLRTLSNVYDQFSLSDTRCSFSTNVSPSSLPSSLSSSSLPHQHRHRRASSAFGLTTMHPPLPPRTPPPLLRAHTTKTGLVTLASLTARSLTRLLRGRAW
jgi:hypothetical protein